MSVVLFHTRAVDLLAAPPTRRRLILAYHRVLSDGSRDLSFAQPGMYVSRDTFEMHVRHLLSNYDLVPLEELLERNEGPACALTFDDGWRDNYVNAFPILRANRVPATIFLATNLVGTTRWPWPDRVSFYIHRTPRPDFSAAFESAWSRATGAGLDVSLGTGDPFARTEEVIGRLKRLEHGLLHRVLACLDDRFSDLESELREERPWLDWAEVEEMADHGISFGSHTENHVILTKVALDEARAEIFNSRRVISDRLGRPTTGFCYPNGDYSQELLGVVAEAGYRYAVTTRGGTLDAAARPYELPRMLLHDDVSRTRPMFACTLAGVGGWRQFRASRHKA